MPVVWGEAHSGDGRFAMSAELVQASFALDGKPVSLARVRVVSFAPGAGADVAAEIVADIVDERGLPVARDRAARIAVAGGRATLSLLATTLDGRPDPGVAAGRSITFADVTLGAPSRAPDRALEVTESGAHPIGARVDAVAVDGEVDRVELDLIVRRADGSELHVDGVRLDAARQGGVVVRGATQSHGRVALAVWGRCDVRDADGRTVAEDRPVQLYILPGGVTQVAIDGVVRLELRGTRLK